MSRSGRFFAAALAVAALVGCGGAEEREAKYFERGAQLFEQGDYTKARLQFKNVLQINPRAAPAYYYLGLIAETEGDLQGAFANFLRVTEQESGNLMALMKVGNYLFAAGDLKHAEMQVNTILGMQPENVDALALRAAIALRQQRKTEAQADAERALSLSPGNKGAVSVLTGLHMSQGNVTRAIQVLEAGIAANQDNVALLMLKAEIYAAQQDTEQMERTYRSIIDLAPDSVEHRAALASLFADSGRLDEAERVIRDGIQKVPDHDELKMLLVGFLTKYRGADSAAAELREFIRGAPDVADYGLALAELFESRGDAVQAETVLREMIDRLGTAPSVLTARSSLARIKALSGDKAEAGRLIAEVLKADSQNEAALLVRAGLALDQGAPVAAITDLRSVLRSTPQHAQALRLLVEAHERNGERELALDVLKTTIEIDPLDERSRLRLARMLQGRGSLTEAATIASEVAGRRPDMVEAWVTLARVAIARADWGHVDTLIDRVAELARSDREAVHLRGEKFAAQGDAAEAAKQYEILLNAPAGAERDDLAFISYVDASIRAGQASRAAERLAAIAPSHDNDPLLDLLLGRAMSAQGQMAEAEKAFRRVIGNRPDSVAPYLELGQMLDAMGQPARAIEVYNLGVKGKADIKPLLLVRGLAEERLGIIDKALATYEALLEHDPNSDIAINNYAALAADRFPGDRKQLDKALLLAERFRVSENPLLLDTLAWLHHRLGQDELAAELLDRAGASAHANPQLRFHWAAVQSSRGRADEARQILQAVSAENFPGREEALKLLQSQ
ncbi:MAG TPA: tetratricopeptide repeat protein [Azospirillaceae bacterium]|nr:tetratricopeptide repeat protein [Azospirillaceae bacterium]